MKFFHMILKVKKLETDGFVRTSSVRVFYDPEFCCDKCTNKNVVSHVAQCLIKHEPKPRYNWRERQYEITVPHKLCPEGKYKLAREKKKREKKQQKELALC